MNQLTLEARRRPSGTGAARAVRREGGVPAVLYGHGLEGLPIRVEARELDRVLQSGAHALLQIQMEGESHLAMLKELQRDPVRGTLLHADFFRVAMDEAVRTTVPLAVHGTEAVAKAGGLIEHHLHEVEIECLPGDIPEHIDLDASKLRIGDRVAVGDLKPPPGVRILSAPNETVLVIGRPQAEEHAGAAPAAEQAAAEATAKGKEKAEAGGG